MTKPDRLEAFRRRYALLRPDWVPATALYQQWVAARLTSTTRVLDLGCGRGGIVERLGDSGEWLGIDADWHSLQGHRVPTLLRAQAAAERFPFSAASFDVVVASWVLEHLAYPSRTFQEIARVLSPGGTFLFLTPNLDHPLPRLTAGLIRMQGWLQGCLVPSLYGRSACDAFPVVYQANTARAVGQLAAAAGLRLKEIAFVSDPAYFAWGDLTFYAAVMLEAFLPDMRTVHLVGAFERF